jgi:dimethylaniline monooxygenase (N-oxide forming)
MVVDGYANDVWQNRPWKEESRILKLMGNKYLDPPDDVASTRYVDTSTFPESILPSGEVVFTPNAKRKDYCRMLKRPPVIPDAIIYCTGYSQSFPWLHESYPRPSDATCRNIVNPSQPDIAYIGFVRPGVGAIPPIAEQQAMWWTAFLLGKMSLPTSPPHYHLLAPTTARIQYGVDHSAYMSTLAKDFGGAPGLLELWRGYGWRVMLTYCFGASFVSFYRLVGPFRWKGAAEVTGGELMETVKRRGLIGNIFFGVIPMMFYGMFNSVALVMEVFGLLPKEAEVR